MICRCGGTGWIIAVHKINRGSYSFICSCAYAKRIKTVPKWDESQAKSYEVDAPRELYQDPDEPIQLHAPEPPRKDHAMKAANDRTLEDDSSDDEIPW